MPGLVLCGRIAGVLDGHRPEGPACGDPEDSLRAFPALSRLEVIRDVPER